MGRRIRECVDPGGDRSEWRRLPGSIGRSRRNEGGQSQLGELLQVPEGTRPGGRETHRRRQMPGHAGSGWRGVPGGQIPALYRPFLPERIQRRSQIEDEDGCPDAQGDPRSGEQESRP